MWRERSFKFASYTMAMLRTAHAAPVCSPVDHASGCSPANKGDGALVYSKIRGYCAKDASGPGRAVSHQRQHPCPRRARPRLRPCGSDPRRARRTAVTLPACPRRCVRARPREFAPPPPPPAAALALPGRARAPVGYLGSFHRCGRLRRAAGESPQFYGLSSSSSQLAPAATDGAGG